MEHVKALQQSFKVGNKLSNTLFSLFVLPHGLNQIVFCVTTFCQDTSS